MTVSCLAALVCAAASTEIDALSLHDALPISIRCSAQPLPPGNPGRFRKTQAPSTSRVRSEEHTSELQSRGHLVCRLLLERKQSRSAVWLLGSVGVSLLPECRRTCRCAAPSPT